MIENKIKEMSDQLLINIVEDITTNMVFENNSIIRELCDMIPGTENIFQIKLLSLQSYLLKEIKNRFVKLL
jgi:hypothetical protein